MSRTLRQTDPLRKLWIYFKKGKGEIWFIIGIYNTVQLWALRGLKIENVFMLVGFVSIASVLIGWFSTKKLDTTNPYVNPYSQDAIMSSICANEGMIAHCRGNNTRAIELFEKALTLRYKWLDRDDWKP